MKGFILAAGFGQRMLPITETIPKPLLPIGNLPLIGYAIKLLAHHGITDIIINLHYLRKSIRDALGDGSAYGVKLTFSEEEDEILGTGGGLKNVHELVDDTLVVVNSDIVFDVDLHAVLAEHKANKALATMVLRKDERPEESKIETDASGRIVRILGNPASVDVPTQAYMFTGVHVLEPRFLEYLPPDVFSCVIRYGYTKALKSNEMLHGVVVDTYWADAGTPARYLRVNEDALNQTMKLRHADPLGGYALSPKREVADVVRMGNDVDLGASVRIQPPVLLGDDARLGDRAVVGPGSIIGARANIGKDAQVTQSIVLEGARVEAGAKHARMLIGKKAMLALDDEKSSSGNDG